MTVYVVTELRNPRLNIKPAEKFGEIIYVNKFYVYGDELDDEKRLPDNVRAPLWRLAKKFNPSNDYLLIAGDEVQMLQAAAAIGSVCPWFFVLRWDRKANEYIPIRIQP